MIHSVTANKDSFKTVTFTEGLNLIVADRSQNAGTTDSRNGLGKSTLFYIIDFCLGADATRNSILPQEYLPDWEFTIDIDLRNRRVKVTRAVDDSDVIRVEGNIEGLPIPPDSQTDDAAIYSVETWRALLGWVFFDIPLPGDEAAVSMMPTFRRLIAYFIRKTYDDPLLPIKVPSVDELAIAYLLGLNWEYLSQLDPLNKSAKEAQTIRTAAKIDLKKWDKSEASLRSECRALETDLERIRTALEHFDVIPGYEEIEKSVNEMTKKLHWLRNQIINSQSRLDTTTRQLNHARAALLPVEELYAECGLVFPDAVKETLENVKRFHEEVTGSRRVILEREVRYLTQALSELKARALKLSQERAEAMKALESGHALGEYTVLNQRYAEKEKELQMKKVCLAHLAEAKQQLEHVKESKSEVGDAAKDEFESLRHVWNESETFFRTLTGKFYRTPGSLNIQLLADPRKYGFKFDPRVESDLSEGIKKIKVFAFDLTLFHQQRVCEHPIDFLIHDSKIYDSTDPRQVANALIEADRISRELGGQYICAINSDKLNEEEFKAILPPERSEGFIKLRLSDESDATKLLGISFGRETEVPVAVPPPPAEGATVAGDGEPPDETASGQQQGE